MEQLSTWLDKLPALLPSVMAVAGLILVLILFRIYMEKRAKATTGRRWRSQLVVMFLSLAGILVVIMLLPDDKLRGQLLSLFGILLSAAIALSSTTLLGNVMAGFMLRVVRPFKPGDFIRVAEHFGRVSEQGLFHVEIQTEDRDLTTLPNLFLVTNPVKVIRSSGTFVSAEVSLGYDLPHGKVESLLIAAAESAKLQDPFVQIIRLGDFAVTYRVAGLLDDVKQLISYRSRLKAMMLDKLHEGGIEIVSPTFMNTRMVAERQRFVPPTEEKEGKEEPAAASAPEKILFDKADEAESVEKLRQGQEALKRKLEQLKENQEKTENKVEKEKLKAEYEQGKLRLKRLADIIKRKEEEKEKQK